ncbi:MAG: ribonuclease H-like domain-containing protein [Nitrospirae bacterium]|nr:ribonuclease H-like domain-containing protein [Nitrospirota bacterium]
MSRVIFDIETAGFDFESLDSGLQEYFLKWTNTEDEVKAAKDSLSFYPNTAEVVAIGMLNPDTEKGAVYFQSQGGTVKPFDEDNISYYPGTESDVLSQFWETIKKYDTFVTFNGRVFDCPFVLVRSAVCRVMPTRELLPNRYGTEHIDLMDRLNFFGASKRRFSLDVWCRTFGIKSPKSDGVTGYEVKDLFRSGEFEKIARYCAGDLWATQKLLFIWEKYIKFPSVK